jgi:hypothetical protein
VVHNTGTETVGGVKTFSSAPVVPTPGASGNPIRNDDTRLSNERTPLASLANVANGWLKLDSGNKVPQAQLPSIALTEFLGSVATQASMLALTGQRGDWASRSDLGTDWQLTAEPSSTLGNWREMTYPASPVSSVNGRTGAVTGLAEASALSGYQPLDADLTSIAALAPSDGAFVKRVSGAWAGATLVKADVGLGSVDNTADTAKPVSTAQQTALDGKQPLDADLTSIAGLTATTDNILQSVAGAWASRTPAQFKLTLGLVRSDVGLGSVDNTSDTAKPISTATQTALDGKQTLDSDLTSIAGLTPTNDDIVQRKAGAWTNRTPVQLKTDLSLTKSDVGLGSVDNTADTAKPVSTAQQTALNGKQDTSTNLSTLVSLAATTGNVIQAFGSAWASRTPAQLKTSMTFVKADVGLGSVDNTADTAKPVSTAQQTALDGKQALDSDLTAFAALTPTNDDLVQRKAGAWTNRTVAQFKTDLGITKSDVGLGSVDNTSDLAKPVSSATQTALDDKQSSDIDLTDIASLIPTNNDVIQRKAGSWTNRTIAQLKSDLAITASDVGAQPVDSDLTTIAGLTATTDNILQSVGSAWASRTPAQLKSTLSLVKADVGLGSVDNTADTAKPISTATQTALDGKQTLDSDLTSIAGLTPTNDDLIQRKAGAWINRTMAQLKTDLLLTKSDVGLGSVDNTADTAKPVSTAQQTALDGKQPLDSDLTAIAGLAPTDGDVLQRVAGAWANRTIVQLKTDLAYTASDVGAQSSDADLTAIAALTPSAGEAIVWTGSAWDTQTPGGGSWADKIETLLDSASVTPNALSGVVQVGIWTCATATPTLNAPINGSQGQPYRVIILASGAQRVISLSGYVASTDDPTTAVTVPSGKWCSLYFEYISAIGWLYMGKKTQL